MHTSLNEHVRKTPRKRLERVVVQVEHRADAAVVRALVAARQVPRHGHPGLASGAALWWAMRSFKPSRSMMSTVPLP